MAFLYMIVGLILDKFYGEEELHLLLNSYNSSLADFFFKYFTKTGEFLFGILILIWLIYKNTWRWVVLFLLSALLQGVTVQGIKKAFFIDHLRPGFYFQEKGIDIHLVEGVKQGITFTFPSGHTATVFFIFLFLTLLTKNRLYQTFFGICAILGAYSRIYLSQHYMQDTVGGALIGIFTTVICYYLVLNLNLPFLNKKVIKK